MNTAQEQAMGLVSAWLYDDRDLINEYTSANSPEVLASTGLIAAALVRCWSQTIGVPPETLLQDLAMAQHEVHCP